MNLAEYQCHLHGMHLYSDDASWRIGVLYYRDKLIHGIIKCYNELSSVYEDVHGLCKWITHLKIRCTRDKQTLWDVIRVDITLYVSKNGPELSFKKLRKKIVCECALYLLFWEFGLNGCAGRGRKINDMYLFQWMIWLWMTIDYRLKSKFWQKKFMLTLFFHWEISKARRRPSHPPNRRFLARSIPGLANAESSKSSYLALVECSVFGSLF